MKERPAVDINDVMNHEAQVTDIRQERVLSRKGQPALGVSFSGGGIRSATFHLGILQGLTQSGLLPRIDYLSTVSGGGYIGTWLHGVIKRYGNGDPRGLERLLTRPESEPHTDAASDPIEFLRKYSSYLAPDIGLFSADFWVIFGIWVRNVLLNQLILVPFLAAVSLLIFFIGSACGWYASVESSAILEVVVTVVLLLAIVVVAGKGVGVVAVSGIDSGGVPKRTKSRADRSSWDSVGAATLCAVLILLASLGTALSSNSVTNPAWLSRYVPALVLNIFPQGIRWILIPIVIGLVLSILFFVLQWQGKFVNCFRSRHGHGPLFGRWAYPLMAGLATGFVFFGCMKIVALLDKVPAGSWNIVAWGPPLLAIAILAGSTFHLGLLGVDYDDNAREWLARVGAIVGLVAFCWAVLFTISVYGPLWVTGLAVFSWKPVAGLGGGWILTSAAGALSGHSSKTGAKPDEQPAKSKLEWIGDIAPTVFIVGYLLLISFGMHVALAQISGIWASAVPPGGTSSGAPEWVLTIAGKEETLLEYVAFDRECVISLGLLAGMLILAWYLPRRIDINEFSMHHFYKNRLVRCYLGATQGAGRHPSRFTGFDPCDDMPLADFRPDRNYLGPLPIINGCLNLNRGSELAKKERKGSAFLLNSLYCGFDPPQSEEDGVARQRSVRKHLNPLEPEFWRRGVLHAGGYRQTAGFGYPKGYSIGTCMAISGAAASPNGGYHTSGPMAFLMTLFNVRLGWWVGNTRRDIPSTRPGPHHSLMALLAELFAVTNARSNFVNISDGGHFENLGLYELVRRRCRYIISGDGEQDGAYNFGSLGGAVRKCRTDFGAEIKINPRPIGLNDRHLSGRHCVVGKIIYALREGETEQQTGWLLYLKASLTGDEPEDVAQYKSSYPDFPQQPTANQFFTESQFESYRKLGRHVWESALAEIPVCINADLDRLFSDLDGVWNPPSAVPKETESPSGITIAV